MTKRKRKVKKPKLKIFFKVFRTQRRPTRICPLMHKLPEWTIKSLFRMNSRKSRERTRLATRQQQPSQQFNQKSSNQ